MEKLIETLSKHTEAMKGSEGEQQRMHEEHIKVTREYIELTRQQIAQTD